MKEFTVKSNTQTGKNPFSFFTIKNEEDASNLLVYRSRQS